MNDIVRPKTVSPPPVQAPGTSVSASPAPPVKPPASPSLAPSSVGKRSGKKIALWILGGVVVILLLAAATLYFWYLAQLQPRSTDTTKIKVTIVSGSSPAQIGRLLEQNHIIRSGLAFDIYTRVSKTGGKLQAGLYRLSPGESTQQIVDHLVAGKVDEFKITFLPGATLAENRSVLIKTGYSASEVDAALNKTYDHPLFAHKPPSADLEGYIFGETYRFAGDTTVQQILKRTFDEYWQVITANNLTKAFTAQGLNLYQGITLASIIQREVSNPQDQKQVAQVFYTRLAQGMPLGSDVTYLYAAKKRGVTPSIDLDSPYNTRKYAGLPPGPIAVPGVSALRAVAAPAAGDFEYFLSGDDGHTYFAHTFEEHQANIIAHCQKNCQVL